MSDVAIALVGWLNGAAFGLLALSVYRWGHDGRRRR